MKKLVVLQAVIEVVKQPWYNSFVGVFLTFAEMAD